MQPDLLKAFGNFTGTSLNKQLHNIPIPRRVLGGDEAEVDHLDLATPDWGHHADCDIRFVRIGKEPSSICFTEAHEPCIVDNHLVEIDGAYVWPPVDSAPFEYARPPALRHSDFVSEW